MYLIIKIQALTNINPLVCGLCYTKLVLYSICIKKLPYGSDFLTIKDVTPSNPYKISDN